jgi:hypothetical protein
VNVAFGILALSAITRLAGPTAYAIVVMTMDTVRDRLG